MKINKEELNGKWIDAETKEKKNTINEQTNDRGEK